MSLFPRCFLYNVKSHLWLLHAAKDELEKSEGAFITTASVAGIKPSGSSLPYAVSKSAAIHLSKSLAVICSPKIRVNSVSPGLLLTDWGMSFGPEKIEAATNATKLKRLATVEVLSYHLYASARADQSTGRRRSSPSASNYQVHDWPESDSRQWSHFVKAASASRTLISQVHCKKAYVQSVSTSLVDSTITCVLAARSRWYSRRC